MPAYGLEMNYINHTVHTCVRILQTITSIMLHTVSSYIHVGNIGRTVL